MRYFDLKGNWRRVRQHLTNPRVADTLVRDFNKYTFGRWEQPFLHGMLPTEFETCDWQIGHRGRPPAFWAYTKHSACHWLVSFALELAMASLPKRSWRIITSEAHSTVWDGETTLFDLNFFAFGISAEECFRLAREHGRELKPGQHLRVHFAEHFSVDVERGRSLTASPTA